MYLADRNTSAEAANQLPMAQATYSLPDIMLVSSYVPSAPETNGAFSTGRIRPPFTVERQNPPFSHLLAFNWVVMWLILGTSLCVIGN